MPSPNARKLSSRVTAGSTHPRILLAWRFESVFDLGNSPLEVADLGDELEDGEA